MCSVTFCSLQESSQDFRRVCAMKEKLEDMLIFPNDAGKDEVIIWVSNCEKCCE